MSLELNRDIINKFNSIAECEHLLPIKITPFYMNKITEEIKNIGSEGPLFRCAFPTNERLTLRAPYEVSDYVMDHGNMPSGVDDILIQKYEDRVLFLSTFNCFGHCQYCFRTCLLTDNKTNEKIEFEHKLNKLIEYVNEKENINEVIFSGGDPLTLTSSLLDQAFKRLKEETNIKDIRIHTRSIVYSPEVFDDRLVELLSRYNVRLVLHITHPYEICEIVAGKMKLLRDNGIRVYNQFPILRKINDNTEVLKRHLCLLDSLGVRQLSIFIPDPINYSACFRIPFERLFKIMDELNWTSSSWINSLRFVLDTNIGKVRRENIKYWDKNTGIITFERDSKEVIYRDFPLELDEPGELSKLLWKKYKWLGY